MRRITAWILALAVLMSMGLTAFAEPADGQTEPQDEITENINLSAAEEEENDIAPQNIGGVDAETDIVVGDTAKTNLALSGTAYQYWKGTAGSANKAALLNDGKYDEKVNFFSGTNTALDNMRITIDFGKTTKFNQMKIYAKKVQRINTWEIQYSDDNAKWTPVTTGTNPNNTTQNNLWWDSTVFDQSFADVEARYVQFRVTAQHDNYKGAGTEFYEVEVYYNEAAKPKITLKGDAEMELWQGETFTDPGATAVGADGKTDLTQDIKVTGTVDTTKSGTYTLSYNVKETIEGNEVAANSVTRTVKVKSTGMELAYTSALSGGIVSAKYDKTEYDPANGAAYQWMRAAASGGTYTDIEGATGATYTLTGADSGSYLKLKITPQNGTPVVSTNHVSVGNLALGQKVSATGANTGTKPVTNINDGNADTDSQGYGSSTQGIYVIDLGAERKISLVRMYTTGETAKKVKHFKIEYTTSASGDSDWNVAKEVTVDTTATSSLNEVSYTFDAVKARRVRLNMDDLVPYAEHKGTWYITEFEVYNAPSTKPTVTLNGTARMLAEKGTAFTDPGAAAKDGAGEDITSLVTASGTVDTNTVGTYTLTYAVTDAWGNVADPVTRTVVVHEKDTEAPTITLNGAPSIRIHQNDTWTDPGAVATDNLDENVTVTIGGSVDTTTLGDYTLTYDATDCYGNKAVQVTRTVSVVGTDEDVTPPTVTLKGDATMKVWQDNVYTEAGAAATDEGTDVSDKITISGSVNTAVLGTYILTYSVSDAAGNIGVATRTVTVVPEPAIEQDKRELKIEGAYDLNAITADLILRTKGAKGSTITWTSSDENVIRADGTVLRPTNGNASVVLTATIANGGETRVKTFDAVTVLQKTSGGIGGGGGTAARPSGGSTVTGSVSGTGGTVTPDTTVPSGGTTTVPEAGTLSGFADMKEAAWADLAVSELTKRGIISGVGNGNFEPSRAITREEFVKIIMTACGFANGVQTADFADVPADAWYAPYVAAAKQLGLVGGTGDGTFGVGRDITREEMATIICRAAQIKGIELSTAAGRADFTDDGTISDWAKENVYALQQAGILSGMGDGSFAPERQCTRAEAAKVVYELTKYMW